ncbi:hypothetical protein [Mycolicibacterium aichiense]|uniref:Uncharacterized protein n=1 Tax=Mycolicibacterium aichiense TaxID=1799 RepID=A0AAD1MCV7_9MYCO|nr:hypothetical protein [Mycolicibacterium aichiense]MCV7020468.1 hypothetical protein [Mycolicibacterium aichiense]BBX07980.1 hypothetical protein MAIC_27830 [Mycolicibacterium aichiense]STZ81789.1 Uncharacterised protein [Mycolicibacterium aichiense]
MGILVGFAPWIVYWVLVGNAPFTTAVLVALIVAILGLVMSRTRKAAGLTFEIGSVAAFFVLTVLTFVASQAFLEQWILPLSTAGILLITLVGTLAGTPFVREFAAAGRSEEIVTSEPFRKITSLLTWIWIAAFAGMTVSSAIPPIAASEATILDTANALSVLCYWVIPFALLGLAAVAARILPDTMVLSDDVVRETSFVAYSEAAIDELYYLAQEHANREVGAGKEAYDVKVGGMGMTLTGDESRKSWPSTYRVRDRRR